jgi:hypothetical protein
VISAIHSLRDRFSEPVRIDELASIAQMSPEHDDAIRAAAGTIAAYFCYPVRPGIIQTTAYFADAAERAGLKA